MVFLLLLLIGILAGTIAGLLGLGGGILFTPVLFYLFAYNGISDPVIWSIGTSLFCTFLAAGSSVVRQVQQHNFFAREGLILGILGASGVYAGRLILTSGYYSDVEFSLFFSALLLFVAYNYAFRSEHKSDQNAKTAPLNFDIRSILKRSSTSGLLGGFVASLAGIGGGSVMVPIMNLVYRIPLKKAVSISSTAIILISLSGWGQLAWLQPESAPLTKFSIGYIDFGTAFPLIFGGFIGGFGGAWLNHYIPQRILQWSFALLALVIAAKMIAGIF